MQISNKCRAPSPEMVSVYGGSPLPPQDLARRLSRCPIDLRCKRRDHVKALAAIVFTKLRAASPGAARALIPGVDQRGPPSRLEIEDYPVRRRVDALRCWPSAALRPTCDAPGRRNVNLRVDELGRVAESGLASSRRGRVRYTHAVERVPASVSRTPSTRVPS